MGGAGLTGSRCTAARCWQAPQCCVAHGRDYCSSVPSAAQCRNKQCGSLGFQQPSSRSLLPCHVLMCKDELLQQPLRFSHPLAAVPSGRSAPRMVAAHLGEFVMPAALRELDLSHVELADAVDGPAIVYDCWGLPLSFGQNNIHKVLACRVGATDVSRSCRGAIA